MPVYLCRPGHASSEPWRHGVQVYAYPFRIDGAASCVTTAIVGSQGSSSLSPNTTNIQQHGASANARPAGHATGASIAEPSQVAIAAAAAAASTAQQQQQQTFGGTDSQQQHQLERRGQPNSDPAATDKAASAGVGVAVRRVRHAEVVLADEVSASYGRYWLRLRWPGPRGGVAGYIALGVVPPGDIDADPGGAPGRENDLANSTTTESSATRTATAMAGATVGEREFRYRTQMSEVSDLPPGGASRNDSMIDTLQEQQQDDDHNDNANIMSEVAAAAAAEAARAAISGGATPTLDTSATDVLQPNNNNRSEPNSGAATPVAAAASSPTVGTSSSSDIYQQPPKCELTGLYFPSSAAMKLMSSYDDGLIPPARRRADSGDSDGEGGEGGHHNLGEQIGGIFHPHHRGAGDASTGSANDADSGGEPVFCRICREGLHDVNYDLDAASGGNDGGAGGRGSADFQAGIVVPPPPQRPATGRHQSAAATAGERRDPPDPPGQLATQQAQQPLIPPSAEVAAAAAAATRASAIVAHHPSAENPLLAPCLCTGSMAFVHYLCVEQWRCRSRHPAAKAGLNCETCGGAYTLPPPPTRPAAGVVEEADWLEAMPAHVLAALRRPHPWWQIGTAIVRRRWLRPFAPIIMSPIVALYCRARRTLKKRGVSRRRWACSLCRRRARWKCVRCLRSYYCSRQCQNVSWHIVHKHLCYKPARFWWSMAVYGAGTMLAFPGILRDPVVYDLGLSCLIGSFVIMGVIGGSVATALKRGAGVDIRGRTLELAVVALTLCMTSVTWGLVWGFFGESSRCWGAFSGLSTLLGGKEEVGGDAAQAAADATARTINDDVVAQFWYRILFRPAKILVGGLDKAVAKTGPLVTRFFCSPAEDGAGEGGEAAGTPAAACLRMARKADPEFFLPEHGGEKCASDITTVTSVLVFAGVILMVGTVIKRRERQRRNAAAAAARVAVGGRAVARHERDGPRPHQD